MATAAKPMSLVAPTDGSVHSIGAGNFTAITKLLTGNLESSISIVEHTLAPRTLAAPLHRHSNEDEISYVLAGELTIMQNGELTIAGAGHYVTKPRNIWHTFWNASDDVAVHMMEIIVPGGFEGYFAELETLIPKMGMPDMPALIALGARYGLEYDLSSMPDLLGTYQLQT